MQVEQAVFTSLRSRRTQGYHLVAASAGLDEPVLRALVKWGPSHASLQSTLPSAESFNFHPLIDDWYAVSRTTYGGPEYSRRGGLQVFTHYLVLRAAQLAAYDNHPLCVARMAQFYGHLRLHLVREGSLPPIELPSRPLSYVLRPAPAASVPLHDILRVLRLQDRVALFGCPDPLALISLLLSEYPVEDRLQLSFTTGLKLSIDRSVKVLFAPHSDTGLAAQLKNQGIDSVLCV